MKDSKGEYWHSDELQAEYRSLIEPEEVDEGLAEAMEKAQFEFNEAYAGLSDGLHAHLEVDYPDSEAPSQPADSATLSTFEGTRHGKILAAHWGADASRKLGVAVARFNRIERDMSAACRAEWQDFFHNRMSTRERVIIVDYIVQPPARRPIPD